MTGIIVSTPPTIELPPGSSGGGPNVLPPVTYQYAVLNFPQTWTAKQTFPAGNISIDAGDIATGNISINRFNGGLSASSSTFWRGDGTWAAGGGGGTPGGSSTQVQYNNAGAFAGITGATTDGTTLTLAAPVFTGTVNSGPIVITSASATALAVGASGTTNSTLTVNSSVASAANGLNIVGAATGGTLALSVTDPGAASNLSINAKGTGTIAIGSVSTGAITLSRATTMSNALTYGGVTLANSVTGTGSMVLSSSPALTTPDIGAATGQTVVLVGGNSGVLQNTGTAGEFTVGMQTTTSGVKRSVHIFGSDVGTSAGTNVAGNNGLATIWAVGNGSSFLGGAYDATLTIHQTSNLYRFCNGAGTGPGAGVMTLSAAGNLSMVALTVAPQGRITLTTATAIMTSSVAAATTVYYTPAGNLVPIFDGTNWAMKTFAQLSQLTTDTTKSPAAVANNSNYDLFVWSDSGTLRCTRGPAWTSDIVRGTGAGTTELDFTTTFPTNKNAITNGPGANLGTWVGTIRSNGTASIDFVLPTVASGGGQGKIGVWNAYNRAPLDVFIGDNAASTYNYAVATTWRESAGSTTNQINCVRGLDVDTVDALNLTRVALSNVLTTAASSIGLDSTTAPAANASSDIMTSTTSFALALHSTFSGLMGLGWHYLSSIEWNSDTNASTWVRFATPSMQAGMKARLWY